MKKLKYYPFKEVLDNRNKINRYSIEQDGYFAIICPKCFKVYTLKMKSSIDLEFSSSKRNNLLYYYPEIILQCDCGHEIHTKNIFDPNIAPIIAILNSKGYYTTFSCEGHSLLLRQISKKPREAYCQAYVSFLYPIDEEILKQFPIPAPWFVDAKDYPQFVIRCKESYHRHHDIKDKMRPLRKWAKSLPLYTLQRNELVTDTRIYKK